ncbi:MAG: FAD-binding protein [Alphaproteobacteria bacterium]|nr:FAD-binding protein [Alphaproteobacteria bacterium]
MCLTTPQYRQPWEIYVNMEGERFVCEDTDSVDARERALLEQTNMQFWIVYDQAIHEQAPPLSQIWSREKFTASFGTHPNFFTADSIHALAAKSGVAPEALERTVRAFNDGVRTGQDPLGRRHHPLPIAKPPFYAVQNHGTSVKTYAGLAVDTQLRVVDRAGRPIGNLFAAGEVIGGGVLTGNSFCGGMSVTPALTFGRLLGERLLQWRRNTADAAE